MEIFRSDSKTLFESYQQTEMKETGNRHNLLSAPPLYTMTPKLLSRILKRTDLSLQEQDHLLLHAQNQRQLIEHTMEQAKIFDEFATISEEEFSRHPAQLSFEDAFYETDIPYTYEEYLAHIQATKDFAKAHPCYRVSAEAKQAFRNIQIHIIEGKLVRISKSRTPVIHFVIRHPKMVHALENFVSPITE